MQSTPLVSVLTTAYNPGRYLQEALDGLYAQTFGDFEHILVDNGCSDGSIESIQQADDPRLRLFSYAENIGRTPALQVAFEAARGEFVATLDADDVWSPDHLQKQIDWLRARPSVDLVGTWCRWINEQGEERTRTQPPTEARDICQRMTWENPFSNSSTMFRRAPAVDKGGYDAEYPFAQDFDLWLKLLQDGEANIIPEYLTDIRVLSTSVTRSPHHNLDKINDELRLYQRAASQFTLDPETRTRHRKSVAILAFRYAQGLRHAGRHMESLRWLAWALRHDPLVAARHYYAAYREAS